MFPTAAHPAPGNHQDLLQLPDGEYSSKPFWRMLQTSILKPFRDGCGKSSLVALAETIGNLRLGLRWAWQHLDIRCLMDKRYAYVCMEVYPMDWQGNLWPWNHGSIVFLSSIGTRSVATVPFSGVVLLSLDHQRVDPKTCNQFNLDSREWQWTR